MAKQKRKQPTQTPIPATTPLNPDIDRLANEIAEKKSAYESDQAPYRTVWERSLAAFNMKAPPRKLSWQSNAYFPVVYQGVKTIVPRIKKLVIGAIPTIKYVGNKAEDLEKAVAYYFRKGQSYLAAADILTDSCTYGTGWGKLMWDVTFQQIKRNVPKIDPGKGIVERVQRMQAGLPETEEYEEVEDVIESGNRPVLYHIPLTNIACNCNDANDVDEAEIIETKFVTPEYLVSRSRNEKINPNGYKFGMFDNVEKILAIQEIDKNGPILTPADGRTIPDPESNMRNIRGEISGGDMKNWIGLLTFQGDFYHEGLFYHNGVVNVAQIWLKDGNTHSVTLRVMPCPRSDGRKDYILSRYERVPGLIYGRGLGEILIQQQDLTNDFARSMIDRDKISLHRSIAYNANLVENPSMLTLRMGGLMALNGPPAEVIQEMKLDPTHPGAWAVLDMLQKNSAEISGIKNLSEVEKPGSNRTASGIGMVMGAAGERILDQARDMCEEFIAGPNGLGQGYLTLIRDNLKDVQKITYVNNKGSEEIVAIDPSELTGEYDVYAPTLFERNDRQQDAQGMLQLLQYVAGQMPPESLSTLLRTIWEYMEYPNAEKLFNPDIQSMPLEVIAAALTQMGVDPGQFMAVVNQMAQQNGKGEAQQGGEGESNAPKSQGKRIAPAPAPARGQGTAPVPMPKTAANTGGRVA